MLRVKMYKYVMMCYPQNLLFNSNILNKNDKIFLSLTLKTILKQVSTIRIRTGNHVILTAFQKLFQSLKHSIEEALGKQTGMVNEALVSGAVSDFEITSADNIQVFPGHVEGRFGREPWAILTQVAEGQPIYMVC